MPDLSDFQGRWRVTALTVGGRALPPAMFTNATVVVTGDVFESLGMGAVYKGRMELGPDGQTFAIVFRDGPEQGNRNNGRFLLVRDRWTLCLDMKGGPAPAAMESTAANGYALEVLERAG